MRFVVVAIEKWRDMPPRRALGYALYVGAFILGLLGTKWLLEHWQDEDFANTVIGFSVAWIPFGISIGISYVADLKGASKYIRWGIIVGGLLWSILAWEDKRRTLQSARDQQQQLMSKFDEANAHTDTQVALVRGDLKDDRASAKTQMGEIQKDFSDSIKDLSTLVSKTADDLNKSVAKVIPSPPAAPVLAFGFFPTGKSPTIVAPVAPDKNGVFNVGVNFRNLSERTARDFDVWIQVCDACSFASEPVGFEKPAGQDERVRHQFFQILNPNAASQRITISVKKAISLSSFQIAFRYACEGCGEIANQAITVLASPSNNN